MVAYHSVGSLGFVNLDDPHYITHHPHVSSGLTWEGVRWAFSTIGVYGMWMPVTWVSLMLDVSLFGVDPAALHGMNLLFHLINVLLLFDVALRMSERPLASFFVAALFAVHPQHVEAVAWVTERKELLSTLFGLMTVREYALHGEPPSWKPMARMAAWFALSLGAKPMWITLPVFLLLFDRFLLGRRDGVVAFKEKLPLFGLSLLFGIVPLLGFPLTSWHQLSLGDRLAQSTWAYAEYLRQTLAAWDLSPYHPYPDGGLSWDRAWPSALVLAGLTAAVIQGARRGRPWMLTGWVGFVLLLAPVSGLIQGGQWVLTADRYAYPAHAFLFLGATMGAAEWLEAHPAWRRGVMVGCAAVLLLSTLSTWRQLSFWRNGETLWSQVLRHYPGDSLAWFQLGNHFLDEQRPNHAVGPLSQAWRLSPDNPHYRLSLGLAWLGSGNGEAAKEALGGLADHRLLTPAELARAALAWSGAQRFDLAEPFWQAVQQRAESGSQEAVEAEFQLTLGALRRGEAESEAGMLRFLTDHPGTAAGVCAAAERAGDDALTGSCRQFRRVTGGGERPEDGLRSSE